MPIWPRCRRDGRRASSALAACLSPKAAPRPCGSPISGLRDAVRRFIDRGHRLPGDTLADLIRAFDVHVGTPEDVIASLRADRTLARVTDLAVQVHSIDPPHPWILRSIELVAQEVAPAFGWRPGSRPRRGGDRRMSNAGCHRHAGGTGARLAAGNDPRPQAGDAPASPGELSRAVRTGGRGRCHAAGTFRAGARSSPACMRRTKLPRSMPPVWRAPRRQRLSSRR